VRKEESFCLPDHLESGLRISIPESAHETLRFAADELKTHLASAGYSCLTEETEEGEAGDGKILLWVAGKADGGRDDEDGFEIFAENGGAVIAGGSPRAVLFGTYRFLEEHAGIAWPTPAFRSAPLAEPAPIVGSRRYRPSFPRRGIVLESSETFQYALALIDWSAKNGLNDLFFTVELWERDGERLRPELSKRQLKLTLGGHNLERFFPAEELYSKHPEWFALAREGGGRRNDQPCYSCLEGVEVIIGNVVRFVEEELGKGAVLETLSLWPNDNKHVCGCAACQDAGFISAYIGFLERLRRSLAARGVPVNVEHIAYNAQLEWSMLEEVPTASALDTLIACWGRDYRDSVEAPVRPRDVRFKEAVGKWGEACGRFGTGLTVFEYYSDYWMLTSLFPPLFRTIGEDMAHYRRIGAKGVMSLIVPYGKAVRIIREEISGQPVTEADAKREMDSENAAMWPNLFVFARLAWEGEEAGPTVDRLCRLLYGRHADECRDMFKRLSSALAGLTAYNTDFFKLRFTDAWLRMNGEEIVGWEPSEEDGSVPRARADECRRALEVLGAGTRRPPLVEGGSSTDEPSGNVARLEAYYSFVVLSGGQKGRSGATLARGIAIGARHRRLGSGNVRGMAGAGDVSRSRIIKNNQPPNADRCGSAFGSLNWYRKGYPIDNGRRAAAMPTRLMEVFNGWLKRSKESFC